MEASDPEVGSVLQFVYHCASQPSPCSWWLKYHWFRRITAWYGSNDKGRTDVVSSAKQNRYDCQFLRLVSPLKYFKQICTSPKSNSTDVDLVFSTAKWARYIGS